MRMSKYQHSVHPPKGGVEPPTKFSKRGGFNRTSTLRGELLEKREVTFFRGGGRGEVAIFTKK